MSPQEKTMTPQTAAQILDAGAEIEISARDSQQPLHLRASIQRAIGVMQEQLRTAQEQIAWLGESNTRLRNELVSLAHQGAQANHDAYHDQLTCLPNRRLLLDRLDQALGQAIRQHKQVVLMLLDLD